MFDWVIFSLAPSWENNSTVNAIFEAVIYCLTLLSENSIVPGVLFLTGRYIIVFLSLGKIASLHGTINAIFDWVIFALTLFRRK